MTHHIVASFRQHLALAIFIAAAPAHARITRIVIDEAIPAFSTKAPRARLAAPASTSSSRAALSAELNPRPSNALIQDVALGKDADGN